ncbi:MAG: DUF1707 SHOCT-like domain-containing protein [Solirubrobacteraceae bacterium]
MDFTRLISTHEREAAIHELQVFFERGFIDAATFDKRKKDVRDSKTLGDIDVYLKELRAGYRAQELRATDQERDSAKRRLTIHLTEGQIAQEDYARRDQLVRDAVSAAEINDVFADLPGLKPPRERRGDRFASTAERERALKSLKEAYDAGRLELHELEERIEVVAAARSREEIHAAFRGISQHRLGQPRETVKGATQKATRVGFAVARTAVVAGWLCTCLLIALVWLVSGIGATIPVVLIGLVSTASWWLLRRMPERNRT